MGKIPYNLYQEHLSLAFGLSHFFRLQSCSKHELARKMAKIEHQELVTSTKKSRAKRRRMVDEEIVSSKRRMIEPTADTTPKSVRGLNTGTQIVTTESRKFGAAFR